MRQNFTSRLVVIKLSIYGMNAVAF